MEKTGRSKNYAGLQYPQRLFGHPRQFSNRTLSLASTSSSMPMSATSASMAASSATSLSYSSSSTSPQDGMVHGPDWVEYISGGGAAVVNITMTFPLNKVLFRQQLHGIHAKKALRQLSREGMWNLYRGVLPPLLQKTCSVALMFGAYEHFTRIFKSEFPSLSPTLVILSAGLLSGTCEAALSPFERVQTLLQDHRFSERFKNTPHALRNMYSYGLKECYRGSTAILLRNGPSNVIFFSFRGKLREALPKPTTDAGIVLNDFISGAILGAMISTAWYPVNVVKTRMQAKVGGQFHSFTYTFRKIYRERGCRLRAMFYGAHLNYTRALISWGIINASYEILKSTLNKGKT